MEERRARIRFPLSLDMQFSYGGGRSAGKVEGTVVNISSGLGFRAEAPMKAYESD
jgi:hypothetical protein